MTTERFGIVKFRGQAVSVLGPDLKPGDVAPEFSVQALDWAPFNGLANTPGKVRIIAAVPSLDTEVCDRETRRFNQEAAALSKDISILVISTDLPFTQKRWCGAAGVDQVTVLSDHMGADFGMKYGCLIKEARILRRRRSWWTGPGKSPTRPTCLLLARNQITSRLWRQPKRRFRVTNPSAA